MHFLREAEHLNIRNEAMGNLLQSVAERFMAAGHDALDAQTAALRQLWGLAWREAQTQTFGDIYLMILVCFAIATAMVPLMRKVAAPKAPSADAH
jgi:DHA2 family multidrug resistance protein